MKDKTLTDRPLIKNINNYLNNFMNKPNLNFLQIGAYSGETSVWILKNILKNKSSKLYDVDIWNENSNAWGDKNIEISYDQNIKNYTNVIKNKILSDDFFKTNTLFFDFIYVDGGIETNQTYKDIKNSFNFLKTDGLMIVDDYGIVQKMLGKETMIVLSRKNDIDKFILENKEKIYSKLSHGQMLLEKINNG
jgi:hypothetical protein